MISIVNTVVFADGFAGDVHFLGFTAHSVYISHHQTNLTNSAINLLSIPQHTIQNRNEHENWR